MVWIKSLVVQVKVLWGRSWVSADKQFCKLSTEILFAENCLSTEIIAIYSNVCTSRLDLAMPSQNKSSPQSTIAKGVKTGTDPFLPQNSH